jgi:hypothetical protein
MASTTSSPGFSFSTSRNPVSNIGWAILEGYLVPFAPLEKVNGFAINQRHILQVQYYSGDFPLRRDQRLQFRQAFVAHSTDKRQNDMSVGAAKNLEHLATVARRGPTYLDEKRSLVRIVDGEFSSNVGKSPNHKTSWISGGDVGVSIAPTRPPRGGPRSAWD